MTTSRLKFELIDGCESTASAVRRTTDMTTSPLASSGKSIDTVDWSRTSDSLRGAGVVPSVFDPSLLNDLAEGLEFLHRQLDDSDSDLERAQEQSRAFESDARRWEAEATRMRVESEDTRQVLDQLRKEFDQARDGSRQSQEVVDRLVEEVAEMRSARIHLETLAAEQQRALVVSLELLKRLNSDPPVAPHEDTLELRRLVELAVQQRVQTDKELADVRSGLEARTQEWEQAQSEILFLRTVAVDVQAELESAKSEFASTRVELEACQAALQSTKAELELSKASLSATLESLDTANAGTTAAQEDLKRLHEGGGANVEPQQSKAFEVEKGLLLQRLQDTEAEVTLQNAEVESRGAIIVALESALEEQTTSLRTLEERFLAYAEQVQALQLQRLEMPTHSTGSIASKLARIFSPPKRNQKG